MKKIILFLLAISIVFSTTIIATAEDNIAVYIDGVELKSDKAPYIDNGRTMVPMRKIFERLDATVDWDGDTQTITATKGTTEIKLQIGNATLTKNNKAENLDVAPVIVGDTTYVPARAVAQALGTNVEWLADISTVNITSPGVKILNKYPNIILPNYEKTKIINDNNGEGCLIRFLDEKNDDFRNDFPIPKDKIGMLNNWIDELEKIGWNNKKIEPEWDWDNGIKYDFYENSISECMYGFTVNLDFFFDSSDGYQYLCIAIAPYNYEIIYKSTGEFKKVKEGEKTAYDYALEGWSISWPKKFTIYDSENNSLDVYDYEAIPYLNKGWSTEPYTVTLYDIYGYSSEIPQHEVEEYLQNGWYYEPVTKMYAEDGRTMYVADSEVEAYEAVGWYTFPPELNQHLINPDYNSDNNDSYRGSTVYVAASGNGTKYHYRSTCIKNSRSMNINDARSLGYTACSKCAK